MAGELVIKGKPSHSSTTPGTQQCSVPVLTGKIHDAPRRRGRSRAKNYPILQKRLLAQLLSRSRIKGWSIWLKVLLLRTMGHACLHALCAESADGMKTFRKWAVRRALGGNATGGVTCIDCCRPRTRRRCLESASIRLWTRQRQTLRRHALAVTASPRSWQVSDEEKMRLEIEKLRMENQRLKDEAAARDEEDEEDCGLAPVEEVSRKNLTYASCKDRVLILPEPKSSHCVWWRQVTPAAKPPAGLGLSLNLGTGVLVTAPSPHVSGLPLAKSANERCFLSTRCTMPLVAWSI